MFGHIRTSREITDLAFYKDSNTFRLFFHCLIKANFKPAKWNFITIQRGQFSTSINALSDQLELSIQNIRTALLKLEKHGEVTRVTTDTYTLITICNYDTYAGGKEQQIDDTNKVLTRYQQTTNKVLTTIEERKKEIIEKEEEDFFDKRQAKQLPFDIVTSSESLTATFMAPYTELKKTLKNVYQIEAQDKDIKLALHTFSTVAVDRYDKYKGIRNYDKLCNLFIEWIPKSIDFANRNPTPSSNGDSNKGPLNLEEYILGHYRDVDLKHFRKDGKFDRWNGQLQENSFRLSNVAKAYKNSTITALLLFEVCYMPLGNRLNGSTPDRKLESFKKLFDNQNDYKQERGDMRKILKEWSKAQSL